MDVNLLWTTYNLASSGALRAQIPTEVAFRVHAESGSESAESGSEGAWQEGGGESKREGSEVEGGGGDGGDGGVTLICSVHVGDGGRARGRAVWVEGCACAVQK